MASDSIEATRKMPGTLNKLPPIPQGARIQKRPLTRRQPPASTKTRTIYVSSSTPLMSAVKRVRKQLDSSVRTRGAAQKNASLHARIEALQRDGKSKGDRSAGSGTVVTVMGTGKAVEKTLTVASFFEQQADCVVGVKTGTVATVDDVVLGDEEEDESRIRRVSCLEVSVQLK